MSKILQVFSLIDMPERTISHCPSLERTKCEQGTKFSAFQAEGHYRGHELAVVRVFCVRGTPGWMISCSVAQKRISQRA